MIADAAPVRFSLRARCGLLVAGIGIAAILIEAMLRVLWINPWAGVRPEHVVTVRMHPRGVVREIKRAAIAPETPSVRFRTDDRAYILPNHQFERPELTIAFLGGSTTECSLVQEPLRFPALVSGELAKRGRHVNTLNAGRSGNTLHDSFLVFINHVVEDRPDAVVVMHTANDIGVLDAAGSYETREGAPLGLGVVGRYVLQIASARSSMAGLIREFVAAPRLTPPPAAFTPDTERVDDRVRALALGPYRSRLIAFVRTARAFGIGPILMTEPLASMRTALSPDWTDVGRQELFNDVVRTVAREESAPLIDLARLVSRVPGWEEPMTVFYDGVHVTDAGSRVYAELIAEALDPIVGHLREQRSSP
jgi:lysophospholipase L1-like esterase